MAQGLARWAAAVARGRPTPGRPSRRQSTSESSSREGGLVSTWLLPFCAYLSFLSIMLSSARVSAFGLSVSTRQQLRRSNIHSLVVSSSSYSSAAAAPVVGLHTAATPLQSTTTYECLFDIQVPEGRCVGRKLPDLPEEHPDALVGDRILEAAASAYDNNSNNNNNGISRNHHWIYDHLHADEIRYGLELGPKTQASFWMGRLALRQCLSDLNPCSVSTRSILKDAHGRPKLPPCFLGSISHKRNTGVALVALAPVDGQQDSPRVGIGVDIEETTPKRRSVAPKVLTPNEISNLGRLPDVTAEEEVLLRFGLKESIYKAMHPLICQYVGFMEAEVHPLADGTATATFMLKSGVHEKFGAVTAHWQRIGEFFLSTSSVHLRDDAALPLSDRDECKL